MCFGSHRRLRRARGNVDIDIDIDIENDMDIDMEVDDPAFVARELVEVMVVLPLDGVKPGEKGVEDVKSEPDADVDSLIW